MIVDKEAKRQALVDALKRITPEMRERLRDLKREGETELQRPDFVWHILLQSFATWGGDRGYEGLIGNQDNYRRVSFKALSRLDASERPLMLERIFLAAKVRYAVTKARLMSRNYDLVLEMGGPEEATRRALAQDGREAKIAFMQRFHGIGPKYARNIWMDAYHPDFYDSMAIDLRIKKITKALGCSLKTYEEEERFYQGIAKEADLQGWELDRLLYNYTDHFKSAIAASEDGQEANHADRFG
jgi:hypothetical protein